MSSVRKCRIIVSTSRASKANYYCDDDNDDHVTVPPRDAKAKITTVTKTLRFGSDSPRS